MMKIIMLKEINFTLDDGEYSKLHEGRVYEAIQESTYFLVPVEGRHKEVYVPKDFARLVGAEVSPNVKTGTIQMEKVSAGESSTNAPIKKFVDATELQLFAPVVRPESDHYHTGGVDVWQFADENFNSDEVLGFHRINIIKYVTRYGKKNGYNRTDLEKARVMIDKLLELHDKER